MGSVAGLENKKPRFREEAGRRQIGLFRCVQAVRGLVLLPWFCFPAVVIIPSSECGRMPWESLPASQEPPVNDILTSWTR
jgi:hypothetical protein